MSQKFNILIVDDEQDILNLLTDIISQEDEFETIQCSDPLAVFDILAQKQVHLILLDIMMPDINGYDISRLLKNTPETKNIPIVFITARGNPARALETGAEDFIIKPFSIHEVIDKIKKYINKKDAPGIDKFQKIAKLLQSESINLSQILFEVRTGLPLVTLVLPKIKKLYEESKQMAIIYVDIVQVEKFSNDDEWLAYDKAIEEIASYLKELKGQLYRKEDVIAVTTQSCSDIVLFLSGPREKPFIETADLEKIVDRLKDSIYKKLYTTYKSEDFKLFDIYFGYSIVNDLNMGKLERVIFKAIKDSTFMAYMEEKEIMTKRFYEIQSLIKEKKLQTYYQKIENLKTKELLGYEAFTRGAWVPFDKPEFLFSVASQGGMIWQLESQARDNALKKLKNSELFFINTEPIVLMDKRLLEWTPPNGYKKDKIVFEITERSAINNIEDFTVYVDKLRKKGYKFAIDDVGSGYSSLLLITKLKPDYIKMDISLIRNVHKEKDKVYLIEAIKKLCESLKIEIIAEGIEKKEEYEMLKKMGIEYGQGYYIQKPFFAEKETKKDS